VATAGNTLGGALDWWMGYGAHKVVDKYGHSQTTHVRALNWLERLGPKACLLAWLPVVGDPLCAVAGLAQAAVLALCVLHGHWQSSCAVVMTALLIGVFPGQFTF
jgi:membrane protein YqaA with SNARE-associated domain